MYIHVWYIYLQNWVIFGADVGKYSSTMEHMGYCSPNLLISVDVPKQRNLRLHELELVVTVHVQL